VFHFGAVNPIRALDNQEAALSRSAVQATYYRDHWISIEPERFEHYKQMFQWSEASRPLLEPAGIQPGEVVVDLGCGPGFTALELASWVGGSGRVHGIDVNAEFVEFGRFTAREHELGNVVTFHHATGPALPFAEQSIDCIVAKNVLIYVDDLLETYQECRRVLKRGGRMHAVEGDWPLTFAEPVPLEDWQAVVRAASIAFRTPDVGRRLYGYARAAGFSDVRVSVVCRPDTTGRLLPMVRNLCTYARHSNCLAEENIHAVFRRCEEAATEQRLLLFNPQFLVTATL
jgi:ubiquinone/menaquinone biosynthesis C-methylase UbiE